jgi:sugar phosphate isomerase/epimerase
MMTRREALVTMAGGCATLLLGSEIKRSRLGIVTYALGIHQQHAGLSSPLAFLEECYRLGAGGIQCALGAEAPELRRRAEKYGMHVEAIINPPRDDTDVARFEHDVEMAQESGASVARTVIIPGRRYERFKTLAEFREFEARGLKSLQLAEPVVARHKFRLAVENHKDQLIAEKLAMLKHLSSEWIGLCVDVGNNVALMEDPLETARAFAPFAFTIHIKDMAVEEYADGWLLADVALGDGFLDLKAIVEALRAAKPDVKFNLETITRDPIKLPVRTDEFWATLPGERKDLLARLKTRPAIVVSKLPVADQLALERRHVERSIAYAREKLNL